MLNLLGKQRMITLIVDGLGGQSGPRVPYVQKMGDEPTTGEYRLPDSDFALSKCMQKFKGCMDRDDFTGMAQALREAMEICEAPDEEM